MMWAPNIDRLKGILRERNKTFESVAEAIGTNRDTFTRRIKSHGLEFKISEIHSMAVFIPLSNNEVKEIFIDGVQKKQGNDGPAEH